GRPVTRPLNRHRRSVRPLTLWAGRTTSNPPSRGAARHRTTADGKHRPTRSRRAPPAHDAANEDDGRTKTTSARPPRSFPTADDRRRSVDGRRKQALPDPAGGRVEPRLVFVEILREAVVRLSSPCEGARSGEAPAAPPRSTLPSRPPAGRAPPGAR